MKIIKLLSTITLLSASLLAILGWQQSTDKTASEKEGNVIVVLKFKAQAEKGEQAVAAFTPFIEKVKQEPHFVSITLHVDQSDDTNIMLYEEWEDLEYYNTEHMKTPHILEFMKNSESFLAGPPEITFWEVKKVFK